MNFGINEIYPVMYRATFLVRNLTALAYVARVIRLNFPMVNMVTVGEYGEDVRVSFDYPDEYFDWENCDGAVGFTDEGYALQERVLALFVDTWRMFVGN